MTYLNILPAVAVMAVLGTVPALVYAQRTDITADMTTEEIVQIAEACIDITAARDFEAGTGPAIAWETRSPGSAELTRNQQSSLNVYVFATDAGIASSSGCEITFRTSDLGPDTYASLLADRDPVVSRGMQGFCHNDTFIEAGFWGPRDEYISSLDINTLIIFSNGPEGGEDPCTP